MITLGTLEEITDLRTVWLNEARDFTPWLAEEDNLNILSEAIGLDISVDETESSVGSFSVDIFGSEVGTSRRVIIENQLEDTDHEHLGKLITYASGKDASIVIWIVKRAREEHRSAIEWLNKHTDDTVGFFLCEIKLYRIGNSNPAVKFEVIERPNDWSKAQKKNDAKGSSDNLLFQQRYDYWEAFQDYAFENSEFKKNFNRKKLDSRHFMTFTIGVPGCHLAILQRRKDGYLTLELYIDNDKDMYYELYQNKDDIENSCGCSFDWRELSDRKASRIIVEKSVDFEDEDEWISQFDWIIDTLLKMKHIFREYL